MAGLDRNIQLEFHMLSNYLPRRTYTVATSYEKGDIIALVGAAEINNDNTIKLTFPKINPFRNHNTITLHLDNRTGVESLNADLRVYRCSYKGSIIESGEYTALVAPLEYQLIYSTNVVEQFKSPVFQYSEDPRPEYELQESELKELSLVDDKEHSNKLGVLITKSIDLPHTTVMSFLSTTVDDIFLITMKGYRKSHNLHCDPTCCFAIDHRATYLFEKAYDWNYTIIKGRAYQISKENPLFAVIQRKFIEKNPWELVFFSSPDIEMLHIQPTEIICPEKIKRRMGACQ